MPLLCCTTLEDEDHLGMSWQGETGQRRPEDAFSSRGSLQALSFAWQLQMLPVSCTRVANKTGHMRRPSSMYAVRLVMLTRT